jgi:phage terminase large subunit-like protein
MSHVEAGMNYARQVVERKIPACHWTRLACERQLKDLERTDIEWRPEEAEKICNFISLMPHVKGRWASKTLTLEPWQEFIYSVIFGWYREDGTRRFRTVYIECPRKNAKSTMSAPVGLYMMAADGEEGSEVYSAATTRDQAKIVFSVAKQMARKMPLLTEHFAIDINAHNLSSIPTNSKFEPLSADANSLDGLNVQCAIIDELHAHKTRKVFDVIETATGARRQPLLWLITTAGSDRSGICFEQHTYLKKILSGVQEDDSYFGIIYSIDDDDDWTDEEVWKKANPNWDVSVIPDDMRRLANKAKVMSSAQNNFLTKRLNVWVNADTAWMNMQDWNACGDEDLDIDEFEGLPCWIGIDLASKIDIAAMVQLIKKDDKYYLFGRYYLPEEAVERGDNDSYSGWALDGRLILTEGVVLDYGRIEEDLQDLKSRFEIKEVPYDPFQATQLATRMAAEGFPMVEVSPTVKNFSEAMKEFEGLVYDRKIVHDGCPVLTWMVSNVVCHRDNKDNIYPRKEQPQNKIDGVIAALMCINRAISEEDTTSVYEKRGVIVI